MLRRYWPPIRMVLILAAAVLLIWLGAKMVSGLFGEKPDPTDPIPPITTTEPAITTTSPIETTDTTVVTTQPPETTLPPETTVPPTTAAPTVPGPTPHDPNADFSVGAVDPGWFDDVLFIGDSRTVGLRDYARSGKAEYFCSVGMSVFNFKSRTASDKNFTDQKLEKLLSSKTYGKIFISLGINECGYPLETLINAYTDLVEMVRSNQPDAKIIIQGIMSVSKSYSKNGASFTPSNINKINDKLRGLSDGSSIFYIDVNEFFADKDGYLLKEVSGDGCHPSGKYYGVWANWIAYAVGQLGI
jgi:lysophospholipase L1-like esterase